MRHACSELTVLITYTVERKDGSSIQNVNVLVQDDTAEATLGLWGTSASSPFAPTSVKPTSNHESAAARQGWKSGETILLLQAPSCKTGRNVSSPAAAPTTEPHPDLIPGLPQHHSNNPHRHQPHHPRRPLAPQILPAPEIPRSHQSSLSRKHFQPRKLAIRPRTLPLYPRRPR